MARIAEAALQGLASRALEAHGMREPDAADAARVLVLADLFGIHTHGVSRIANYGERMAAGGVRARPEIRAERVAPALARLDGDNGLGPLVGMRALQDAMAMAREAGIAAVFARASNHFGAIAPYNLIAAESGFASIVGSNSTTTIPPTGGAAARLGNSPIGFAIPNSSGRPIILDMALSVVARAKIRDALKRGETIPDTWATDRGGRPTTDPKAALEGFLQPIGGYKGYGLALIVDLFAGVLSGSAYLTHVRSWTDPATAQDLGHFFVVIDTARLGSGDWLAARMGDFAQILHATPLAAAGTPVRLPGEIELDTLERQRREGIEIEDETLESLEQAAA